ncbi:MAG: 4Fe-4S binding protein [Methanoregula sp.]
MDAGRCDGCSLCSSVCPEGVIVMQCCSLTGILPAILRSRSGYRYYRLKLSGKTR